MSTKSIGSSLEYSRISSNSDYRIRDGWDLIFSFLQAALAEADNVSELAFPDGEQPAARDEDDLAEEASDVEYGFPYYLCKCSFEEYEEYWGEPSVDMDYYDYAWCPCFEYDTYSNGLEYAYEQYEWTDEAAARSLDRIGKKKRHAGRSLDRKKKKKSKKHH